MTGKLQHSRLAAVNERKWCLAAPRLERLLAAVAFVLAVTAILACRPSWSPDSKRVFFPYKLESDQVAVAVFDVESKTMTEILKFPHASLPIKEVFLVTVTVLDKKTIYILVTEKIHNGPGPEEGVTWLLRASADGKILEKRLIPDKFKLRISPIWLQNREYLWMTVENADPDKGRIIRLDLRTLAIDKPFGDLTSCLFVSPNDQPYYCEQVDGTNKIGRITSNGKRQPPILTIADGESECVGLSVGSNRISLLEKRRTAGSVLINGQTNELEVTEVMLFDRDGKHLRDVNLLPLQTNMIISGEASATEHHLYLTGQAFKNVWLIDYNLDLDTWQTCPLPLSDNGNLIMQPSPNGRYLAMSKFGDAVFIADLKSSPLSIQQLFPKETPTTAVPAK